ncbi:MAG: thioredoxin family protein, partial [Propionibacteriaceae bacterium]|nr:thioredoxin family protein [Propionibacteriaceae bacterium]
MSIITLNYDTFENTIDANDMLVLDLWASWCGPCKMYAPVFEAVAEQTEGVTFAKFQTDASDENQEVFEALGFQSIPTTLFFKGGNLLLAV